MMCAVGLVTEQQDFSTYKKPVLYEAQWWSQGLFIFTKSVTICTYFAAVSAAYTTCEKYVGISFSSLSYGLQILFHKSLRLYCKRRLVIFQELLSPAHSEKKTIVTLDSEQAQLISRQTSFSKWVPERSSMHQKVCFSFDTRTQDLFLTLNT